MKLTFAWIENYKSIEKKQKLVVNDKVTAIIGKNESGKSNLIDILGATNTKEGITPIHLSKKNRRNEEGLTSVILEFELSKEDSKLLELDKNDNKFKIHFSEEHTPYKGKCYWAYNNYFKSTKYIDLLNEFNSITTEAIKGITNVHKDTINIIKNRIKHIGNLNTYIVNYKEHLNSINASLMRVFDEDTKHQFNEIINEIESYADNFYNLLPIFHKFSDTELQSYYVMNKEFFEQKISKEKSISNLIKATKCDTEDWMNASYVNPNSAKGQDARKKIRKGMKMLQDKFNQFYKQEYIEVEHNFNNTRFNLYVDSSQGMSIPFTERSNGLRWYFSLFVELESNNLVNKPVVFLIDEPGISLHVNAQKELLSLFDDLTADKNQIIYSTHSPYMIEEKRIDRIVPIQKNKDNSTEIFSAITSDKLDSASKIETLTPLLEAIGMNLHHNIGLHHNRESINIITEGITDSMYLDAMIKHLNLKDVNVFASRSANRILDVSVVLYGFGYNFKALYDYDHAGKTESKKLLKHYTNGLPEEEKQQFRQEKIFFITDAFTEFDNDFNYDIESLLSDEDKYLLYPNYDEDSENNKLNKLLIAQRFCDSIKKNTNEISQSTINRFELLLTRIIK